MSIRVKQRLDTLRILTTHEDRVEIDKEIERITNVYCDKGIDKISDAALREIAEGIKRKKKKAPEIAVYA